MWIVRLALRRPYTFIVASILLLILGPVSIVRTPTDIFPNIDIPVVSVLWNYNGLSPEEMSNRIVFNYERLLTTTVNDIEHIESQSWNGIGDRQDFFPSRRQYWQCRRAGHRHFADGSCASCRRARTPPLVIQYNASSVPILQLALSGEGPERATAGRSGH